MKTRRLPFAFACVALVACSGGSSSTNTSAASSCSEPATTRQALDTEGRCTGAPRGCSLFAATACRQQEGCYPVRGNPSTYADDHCDGSPPSCETRYSESSCEEIRGCEWETPDDATQSSSSPSSEEASPCGSAVDDAGSEAPPSPPPSGPSGPTG